MPDSTPIRWSAPEHEHVERGSDWFFALGIITLATAATSALFGNVLFAVLIVAAGITIGMIARREPPVISFEISDRGIRVGETLHRYEEIISFWVTDDPTPVLLVDTVQVMAPNLIIPLENMDPEVVRAYLQERVDEIPMQEPVAHRLLEFFGL